MEVHAHTHTARKKWTHYFWEFLMLFLAVFCGFLAEYQLEHTIEHQREKKYVKSLVADLKSDTSEIRAVIEFNIIKFHGLDTLASSLNKELISKEDEIQLYHLNRRYAVNIYTMIFNERTIRQLLSSGNLRLISSQNVSDSIIGYYGQAKDDIIGQERVYEEMSKRLIYFAEDIFNNSFSQLKMNADSSFYQEPMQGKKALITRNKIVLTKYSQMILNTQGFLSRYLQLLFDMQSKSQNLLLFLQKKYEIK